jgi:hypothetical protein
MDLADAKNSDELRSKMQERYPYFPFNNYETTQKAEDLEKAIIDADPNAKMPLLGKTIEMMEIAFRNDLIWANNELSDGMLLNQEESIFGMGFSRDQSAAFLSILDMVEDTVGWDGEKVSAKDLFVIEKLHRGTYVTLEYNEYTETRMKTVNYSSNYGRGMWTNTWSEDTEEGGLTTYWYRFC